MGKIRVKTLGDETAEKEQKKEAAKRKEAKKTEKAVEEPKAEAAINVIAIQAKPDKQSQKPAEAPKAKTKKEKFAKTSKPKRSRKYKEVQELVDRNKVYSLSEALSLLPKTKIAKFDETVELHINTHEQGVSGSLNLPHGSGKQIRVVIADDAVLAAVEKGKFDFDILLAHPSMMPKLAKVARFLGPRGLMPNPKNGTVTPNPEEAAKKYQGGHVSYKTESKAPIIHMSVGKVSFGEKKLEENIKAVFDSINATKIKKVTLKSTMSPGIRIQFAA